MERPAKESVILRKGEIIGEMLIRPFQAFISREASSGFLLVLVTVVAVVWVNSGYHHAYHALWHTPLHIGFADLVLEKSLHFWVNDGLMAIFFFVVGLEIKREILVGELASFRKAALPVAAAIGGMVAPALIYTAFNAGTDAARGWAVPMATDIAFTLAALTLLGSRISRGLVIFLVALAIADDLGAVMVIAVFYSADISHFYLVMSGLIFVSLVGINILGYQNPVPYVLLGIILWIMVFLSGVHATLAGVLLALTIPARSRTDTDTFLAEAQSVIKEFECAGSCGYSVYTNEDHQAAVHTLETMCHRVEPPLLRIEYTFHPWVVFLIIPLFGLANAGVRLDPASLPQMLASPVALGVGLGLFLGKQLGIVVASFLALRAGIAALPSGATPGQVYGGAVLCGIGFTMSLFVNDLAFGAGPAADMGKIAIFAGSVLSFVVGMTVLFVTTGTKRGGSESTGMENDSLSRSPGAYT